MLKLEINLEHIKWGEGKLHYKIINSSNDDLYILSWSCSVYDGWSVKPKPVVLMFEKDFDSAVKYFCDKNIPYWRKVPRGSEVGGVLDIWVPKGFDECNAISAAYKANVSKIDLGVYGAIERQGKSVTLTSNPYYLSENCPNEVIKRML